MSSKIVIRPATDEQDRRRLREFTGAMLGAHGLLVLDIHLARARYRMDFTLLVEKDGVLIGSALLHHIRLRMGGALLEAAEIEHLIVSDEDQQALHKLVDTILHVCLLQGLVVLLLHAPVQSYLNMGFTPYRLNTQLAFEPLPAQAVNIEHRVEFALRPLNERLDGPSDLGPLYDISYAGVALSEERKRTDWRGWPGIGRQALILEDRHEVTVGYVVCDSRLDQGLRVYEAALGNINHAEILLRLLREFVASRGLVRLILDLPNSHSLIRAGQQLEGQALEADIVAAMADGPMALCGMVDTYSFLEQLIPELERRLHMSVYAGWHGTVMLRFDQDQATLHIEGSHVHLTSLKRRATCEIELLSLSALTQLLLGTRTAAELRTARELSYEDGYAGLVTVLFSSIS